MYPTISGFKVAIQAGSHRDALVVPFAGIETEQEAASAAFVAARNGYPTGTIDIVSVEAGRWCPTGLNADEAGQIVWVN